MTEQLACSIVPSFIYLTTRHTWNAYTRDHGRLLLPEHELYEVLTLQRRALVAFLLKLKQAKLNRVMETALAVSSSLTGTLVSAVQTGTAEERTQGLSKWSRIRGARSSGRYAVEVVSTVEYATGDKKAKANDPAATSPSEAGLRQEETVQEEQVVELQGAEEEAGGEVGEAEEEVGGEVGLLPDTGMLGVEMDLQLGQMTLRSRHLSALQQTIANHPDVKDVFGDQTIQACLLQQDEHKEVYRLVSLQHDLTYWKSPHSSLPALPTQFVREYDPAELNDSEVWITRLFEPVRTAFFGGRMPIEWLLPSSPIAPETEVAVLVGLHPLQGGPWKLAVLFKRLKCLHVYECVSHGRRYYYTLHLTTDARFTLRSMQPSTVDRVRPFPAWWKRGDGAPYPMGISLHVADDLLHGGGGRQHAYSSVILERAVGHPANLSGGRETYVPRRFFTGMLQDALLEQYRFWADESSALPGLPYEPGFQRLRGYPLQQDLDDCVLLVDIQHTGDAARPAFRKDGTLEPDLVQATCMSGRTVRVLRLARQEMQRELEQRGRIRALLSSYKLLAAPSKKRQKKHKNKKKNKEGQGRQGEGNAEAEGKGKEAESSEDEEEQVVIVREMKLECKWKGDHMYHPAKVLDVYDNGTYDVRYVQDSDWIGQEQAVPRSRLRVNLGCDAKCRQDHSGVNCLVCNEPYSNHGGHTCPKVVLGNYTQRGSFAGRKGDDLDDYYFSDMDESEDLDWASDSDGADEHAPVSVAADITFAQFNGLGRLLAVTNDDEEALSESLKRLALQTDPKQPYRELYALCEAVRQDITAHSHTQHTSEKEAKEHSESSASPSTSKPPCILLNLLYAPAGSPLFSLLQVLTRVENASHILAWSAMPPNTNHRFAWFAGDASLPRLYPPVTSVELPRLKLNFTEKTGQDGVLRLYSVDHVDLFICNERPAPICHLMQGLPHSLLMSNREGEKQVLVPVLPPVRPRVGTQPFTTQLVLDRSQDKWLSALSQRFYLYPVHVSLSFLIPQGINPSLYLLLLRFLQRDYAAAYRIADAVATDSGFNTEGRHIFDLVRAIDDDFHPDAIGLLAKLALVTLDSGVDPPCHIARNHANLLTRYQHISGLCRMLVQEELQLLEAKSVSEALKSDSRVLCEYDKALVLNRRASLRARADREATESVIAKCVTPARTSNKPWLYRLMMMMMVMVVVVVMMMMMMMMMMMVRT
eukprot:g59667.t1